MMCSAGVGIGTTAPTAALQIKNATTAMRITGNLTNASTRPALSTTPGAFEIRGSGATDASDDGFLRLSAGGGSSTSAQSWIDISGYSTVADMVANIAFGAGAERMRIANTGYIGIGKTAPSNTLDITGFLFVNNGVAATTTGQYQGLQISYTGTGATGYANITATNPGSTYNSISLNPFGGNVGIGTTAPQASLHVNGNTLVSNPTVYVIGTGAWYIIGYWDCSAAVNAGARLKVRVIGCNGFGAPSVSGNVSGGETTIYLTNLNGVNATYVNIDGIWKHEGGASPFTTIKVVQNGASRSQYYVYAYVQSYTQHAISAETTQGTIWTTQFTSTSDPGANSASVQQILMSSTSVAGNMTIGAGLTADLGGGLKTQLTGTIVTAATVAGDYYAYGTLSGSGPYTFTTNVASGAFWTIVTGIRKYTTYKVFLTVRGTVGSSFNVDGTGGGPGVFSNLTATDTTWVGYVTTGQYDNMYINIFGVSGTQFILTSASVYRLDTVMSGNVGIGTTNPISALQFHGKSAGGIWNNSCLLLTNGITTTVDQTTNGTSIQLTNGANSRYFNIMTYGYSTDPYSTLYITSNSTSNLGVILNSGGQSWGTYSDSRMKIDVTPLPSALSSIIRLNPVSYLYDVDPTENTHIVTRIGFLADEVDQIYPNLVTKNTGPNYTNSKGETFQPMTLCMTDLIPYLTKGIQELALQTAQLSTENAQLKSQLALLEARLNAAGL